jgi:uncharacterized membrane protein YjgN (DUF898 family)
MAELTGVMGAAHERVDYEGRRGLVGLLSKNYFLTLITIGIYRFWAATRLRRYLWSNIRIGGDGLEYTGTGRELFLGFLVALAVLAPVSVAYILAYRLSLGSPVLAASIQGAYFLALFIFLQVALFRSRRYRLSRTVWRGIYAGQTGSTWHYCALFLGYGVLTVVTLGLALPWMHVALARYKLNNTCFGNRTMHVEAKGSALFGRWLVVMAVIAIPLALAILPNLSALLHPVYVDIAVTGKNAAAAAPKMIQLPHPILLAIIPALAIGLGVLALVWYRIEAFRYLASRVQLGAMRLHSDARGMIGVGQILLFGLGLLGLSIAMGIVFAVLGVIAVPLVKAAIIDKTIEPQTIGLIAFAVMLPVYILLLWVMQLVTYCWLWIPIIKHLATTLDIENFAAVSEIAQSTQPRQKLGIADSFELGAF